MVEAESFQNMEKKSHLNMGSPWFYQLIADKIIFQYLINKCVKTILSGGFLYLSVKYINISPKSHLPLVTVSKVLFIKISSLECLNIVADKAR